MLWSLEGEYHAIEIGGEHCRVVEASGHGHGLLRVCHRLLLRARVPQRSCQAAEDFCCQETVCSPEFLQYFFEQMHDRLRREPNILRYMFEFQRCLGEELCCPQCPGAVGSALQRCLGLQVLAGLALRLTQHQQ